jgi:hypothetical protein
MSTAETNIPFLVQHDFHLSLAKARQAAVDLFTRLGCKCPKGGWESAVFNLRRGDDPRFSMPFNDMVKELRRKGVVTDLQRLLDTDDVIFGGAIISEFATPNFQLNHSTQFAGYSKSVQGPCRVALVEAELTEDILYYRTLACKHSNEYDFRLTARYFRNYLSACVSLVDAFLNRHILVAKADGFDSPEFDQLQRTTNLEKRVELWWQICSGGDPAVLFRTRYWCHFQEIRKMRNAILHAVDPFGTYSLPETQIYLNKVRSGIGEFLFALRRAHNKPTLGFIERLRTAPRVAYQKILFNSDGNRVIHIDQG